MNRALVLTILDCFILMLSERFLYIHRIVSFTNADVHAILCLCWMILLQLIITCAEFLICYLIHRRHRAVEAGHSPYVSLFDTLDIQPSQINVELLNTKNNVRLRLELYGLQHQTARIKINEVSPLKPRYEIPVGDVLVGEPEQDV